VRGALEGLLVLGIAYGIFSELRDALRVRKETGSILKYFSSLWNFIDVLSLALLVYAVIHRRVDPSLKCFGRICIACFTISDDVASV
jgi:hypothetical protein